jgi:predicted nuclease with TOPRIM domain
MSAYERIDELIDDIGIKGFRPGFVEDYIDIEELKETFRDDEENNVRENLEDYFDEDEFEYSDPEVQKRIDELEARLEDSEIDQEEVDELNEELDELKDSDKTIPENLIEEKVENLISDLVDDPMSVIENYGLEIENYIDTQGFKEGLLQSDGIGHTLNSYDGSDETIEFNDETYYILQIDG